MPSVSESDTPEKFLESIENFEKTTYKNINFIIKAISSDLFENVIRDTPVRSGRARNNWVFSHGTAPIYKNVGPTTYEGLKTFKFPDTSGDAAIKKMENGLRRAPAMIKKKQFVLEYYLTNQVPYITRLEYFGHSKQAPAGMARKNTQKYSKYSLTHVSKLRGKI